MRVATGKVIGGKVEILGEPVEEGTIVTVLIPESDGFELDERQEALLLESIREADRGETVALDEVSFRGTARIS